MNDNNNTFNSDKNTQNNEMLDCKDVIARLGDYTDNELPVSERIAMEDHFDECPECAAFLASYTHVVVSAAELREPEQPISVDVQNRLRAALNKRLGIDLPVIA
jgi:anti-sigma factor RsiW